MTESWNRRGGRIREAYLEAADIAGRLVAEPAVAEAWDRPSVLPKWSVRGLAGHMFWPEFALPGMLAAPVPAEPVVSLRAYYLERVTWLDAGVDAPVSGRIRQGGEAAAADGHEALRRRVDEVLAVLRGLLPDVPAERPVHVATWGEWSLELDDLLLTRAMELVVHSDDLACSVGLPTPGFPESVTAPVIDLLTRLAVRRHGPADVVRALSRAERAPASIAGI
ncbi:maleylpyruvate isomerase N-terminal domain-containing protein [Streptomyces sp. SLBN-31]|uniref:maleylpyruvate isomerase N-terminal domain-containing protein n=1 Tax=Streptomyces sp. SLBN-31 TaxID=2768444 RepID=UPI00114F4DCA|nr:maleylpyruvate isomerase N-terminal domain-containing protein [Streptomyces sp. SLBN-31]TQJ88351.1 mycothiol maleylpyruvate isomerase-like protein [Streptomyces sp. SLBN-31]